MLVLFTSLLKKNREGSEFRTRTRKPPKMRARGFYLLDSRVLKMEERTLILFSSSTKKWQFQLPVFNNWYSKICLYGI